MSSTYSIGVTSRSSSRISVGAGEFRVPRCLGAVLMDSAPEPMGRNAVMTRAEVPNVVVVRRVEGRDDLGCAAKAARREFQVVRVGFVSV